MEDRERLASGYKGALLAYRQALGCGYWYLSKFRTWEYNSN